MLIRSQDKKKLIPMMPLDTTGILRFDKGEKDKLTGYAIYAVENTNIILGTYSTEEKAIKVLDMIEGFYANFEFCKIWGSDVAEFYNAIFQMPKDEEVKV